MKSEFAFLSLAIMPPAAILFCLTLSAQEAPRPAAGGLAERFKQLDKNGDGKLTKDEAGDAPWFGRLDGNGDGAVTQGEALAAVHGGAGQNARQKPDGGAGQGQGWQGFGAAEAVPLPPPENFKQRVHGDEAAKAGLRADVLAQLDVDLQRHVAAKNVAGLAALIHKDSTCGYFETFGWADMEAGKPMFKDTIFRLTSLTKPVIVAAALSLLDAGAFTLDEPIARHCPEWSAPKVLANGQTVPAKSALTPRMLMSHSGGLAYGSIDSYSVQPGGAGNMGAGTFNAMRGIGATLKDYSESVAKVPLQFQPGTGYTYGLGIDILGRYLEAVTGKPLDDVLKERVLVPLKMVDTDFWVPPDKSARLCQNYRLSGPGRLEPCRDAEKFTHKPSLFRGGNGLCGTIGDYERFCRMLLNCGELDGVRVLKPQTVELMFQNQSQTAGQRTGLVGMAGGEGGNGWGATEGTQIWIDRKNNLFALFMAQTQWYRAPTYSAFRTLACEAAVLAR